ncbi:MAG: ATP-binding protein [Rhodospirillales bacterium]|nr:ATP-binding protein [Rhodospirillales bacterium]
MIRVWPRSLVGRTVYVLLAGLLISNLVGFAVHWSERSRVLSDTVARQAAQGIAALAPVLENAPPEARSALARQLQSRGMRVVWTPDRAMAKASSGVDPWAGTLRAAIIEELGEETAERLMVSILDWRELAELPGLPRANDIGGRFRRGDRSYGDRPFGGDGMKMGRRHDTKKPPFPGRIALISLQIEDGSWLNFFRPAWEIRPFWTTGVVPPLLITALLIIAISVFAVWRATAPLAMFARAAERLGRDVNAPPMEEKGPIEVGRAARAFNDMQTRIRSFIDDRTQLLAAISHDLRTPITRMRLRAEFVEDEEQRQKMLHDLEEMEAMIAATLSFARDDVAREERVRLDLADLLQSRCDENSDAGNQADYEGETHLVFEGAPIALKRAFDNLIDNAIKYGGRAHVKLAAEPDGVIITISDNGPGIAEDQLENVFTAFYREEKSRNRETGGVGLGLAVVRSVIRAHGGDVSLSNNPEGGLKATVWLPMSSEIGKK